MQIDHIAIAVRSLDQAAERLCSLLGYRRRTTPVANSRQKVNVLFLDKPGSLEIKLIEPSSDDSPLWASLKRGEGLHHLCLKVDDVQQACTALSAEGVRIISKPAPGEAFDDHLIAFLYMGHGLNVELVDTDARRNLVERAG